MPADLRQRLLQLAYELLSLVGVPPDVFDMTVRSKGQEHTLTAGAGEFARAAQHDLSDIQRAILVAAGPEPQPGKALARKTGYAWSSYFRTALAALCRPPLSLLQQTPDGYRLSAPP